MSKAIFDWECAAHGIFESTTGKCNFGCGKGLVTKIFLKPPAFHAGRTSSIDKTLRGMAKEQGLTDMNNHGGDTGVFVPDQKFNKAQQELQHHAMLGQTYAGEMGGGDNAVTQTMSGNHFQADNALESVKTLISKPKPIVHASYTPKTLPKAPN